MSPELLTILGTAATAVIAFARWALRLWATVRREAIEATKASAAQAVEAHKSVAAQASLDHQRMIEALVGQARSMAELGGKIDTLGRTLEGIAEWQRERTPVEGYPRPEPEDLAVEVPRGTTRARPIRTAPYGYRPPKPGDHND